MAAPAAADDERYTVCAGCGRAEVRSFIIITILKLKACRRAREEWRTGGIRVLCRAEARSRRRRRRRRRSRRRRRFKKKKEKEA
jgi:hypothetical protein